MQGALNITASKCLDHVQNLEETLQPEVVLINGKLKSVITNEKLERVITKLNAKLNGVLEELALCKRMIAQGGSVAIPATIPASSKVNVPRPKAYGGSRNTKDIDNYVWGLEQYFKALSLEDAKKVDGATLYLTDAGMIWWRQGYGDIKKDTLTIKSFDDFRRELKKQFYPENAENEARANFHQLSYKNSIQ
ncbi:hypothetical protein IHE45_11G030200 [Dioscorea alata]|uniref:Uncharacterized protein n=1 Tax=Dioscorea alata TaxID=55571 RepID=A0ACB7V5Z4_DIOAL|nr:hypothetical protein IHE45_11G030200 [Dioscorea alata]